MSVSVCLSSDVCVCVCFQERHAFCLASALQIKQGKGKQTREHLNKCVMDGAEHSPDSVRPV